jgi:predicted component of type VI protein secretion system
VAAGSNTAAIEQGSKRSIALHGKKPIVGLPRRKFFSDMPDKGLFAAMAILGFGAVFSLKHYRYDPDHIAAFAVVMMIVYGAVAYHMPLVHMRLDRLGDNFYYLGFVYTLASLSVALFQLRAGMQIEELLGSFGIALVTTIVGIAGRVLFVQLRTELDDVEDRARRNLADASSDLRAHLSSAIADFETVRTSILQILKETAEESAKVSRQQLEQVDGIFKSLRTGFLETLKEATGECAKATKQQVEQIDSLAKSVAKQIEEAFEANRHQADWMTQSVRSVSQSVEQMTKKIASMELPNDRLSSQFAHFAAELEKLVGRLGATIDDVARRSLPQQRPWYRRLGGR